MKLNVFPSLTLLSENISDNWLENWVKKLIVDDIYWKSFYRLINSTIWKFTGVQKYFLFEGIWLKLISPWGLEIVSFFIVFIYDLIFFQSLQGEVHQYRYQIELFTQMTQRLMSSYPNDDTRRIKKATDNVNMRFNNLNARLVFYLMVI